MASLELNGTFQGQFYVVCSVFFVVRLFYNNWRETWMAAKRSERPGGDTPPTKKKRDKSADSPARLEEGNLQLLPGDRCPHCDKDCSVESKAIQCDLCHVWHCLKVLSLLIC